MAKDQSNVSPQLLYSCSLKSKKDEEFRAKEGTMYRWTGTHWQAVPVHELERDAVKFLAVNAPDKCSERTAASCAATAVLDAAPLDDPLPNLVPVQNGEIWLRDLSMRPHDKEHCLTYCLSCFFEPFATAPTFLEFLEAALPDDEVREYLQEFAGYTLLPDTRHQLACWLIGSGGNGKSTFAQIMQALHSKPVSMSLDGLDGFKLGGLVGASLVYCDETPARIDEQRLKTLISGDAIQVDRKYRDAITIRPTAKWIVSGNSLPAISDHSDGFWRRWIIVPFNVKPAAPRPLLAETIIDSELSGVLNWALDGLKRLLDRGSFPPLPEALQAAQHAGKRQSNSVAAWLEDVDLVEAEGRDGGFAKSTIYTAYAVWCGKNGMKAVSAIKFWERMRQAYPELIEFKRGERRTRCVNLLLPALDD